MFKSKRNIESSNETTVLGKGMKLNAVLLSGKGTLKIEGEYDGEIFVDGNLILEKSGHIKGNINAKFAYISGMITGNIVCTEILHITSTGKINGNIESEAILMDEGAVFIGYSKMTDRQPDPLGLEE